MKNVTYHVFECPLGWIGVLGNSHGLKRLALKPGPQEVMEELGPDLGTATNDPHAMAGVESCLDRYFRGEVAALDEIKLDVAGAPPFFAAAWDACRSIPPGQTRSYSWLAQAAGRPLAVRAAGQAMARNLAALVIPCHRVIGSNGCLHGYGGGGLAVKARLLELERASAPGRL